MATIWFSSDHHFHHENIIKYGDRPFHTLHDMNETLIENHNKVIKPSDHWYCLGDVTTLRDNQGRGLDILRRLNGHKRLILGNHDHYKMKFYLDHFEKVMAMNRLGDMWFMHVPCHPLNVGSAKAIVHGHIHQRQAPPVVEFNGYHDNQVKSRIVPYINISVEAINYTPISLEQLRETAIALGATF